mmetsp:Transcript_19788/g.49196  ORF Transcript_19788/g.49196 Transcript_19788/m.49196 type:complete len:271 (-) Transcript_19788:733-1545(-)
MEGPAPAQRRRGPSRCRPPKNPRKHLENDLGRRLPRRKRCARRHHLRNMGRDPRLRPPQRQMDTRRTRPRPRARRLARHPIIRGRAEAGRSRSRCSFRVPRARRGPRAHSRSSHQNVLGSPRGGPRHGHGVARVYRRRFAHREHRRKGLAQAHESDGGRGRPRQCCDDSERLQCAGKAQGEERGLETLCGFIATRLYEVLRVFTENGSGGSTHRQRRRLSRARSVFGGLWELSLLDVRPYQGRSDTEKHFQGVFGYGNLQRAHHSETLRL